MVLPEKYKGYEIVAVNGGCFAINLNDFSSAIISMDGTIIDEPPRNEDMMMRVYKLDDGLLVIAEPNYGYGVKAFRSYDRNGRLVGEFCGEGTKESWYIDIGETGNYNLVEYDEATGYTITLYTKDNRKLCTVNGYVEEAFFDEGFAMLETEEVTGTYNRSTALIDENGEVIQFTIAGNSEYAGRVSSSYVLDDYVNGGRMVGIERMEFTDGSYVEDCSGIIDMKNRRMYLVEDSPGVYKVHPEYIIRGNQVMDKFGQNVLWEGPEISGKDLLYMEFLSESPVYIGAEYFSIEDNMYCAHLVVMDQSGSILMQSDDSAVRFLLDREYRPVACSSEGIFPVEKKVTIVREVPARYGVEYEEEEVERIGYMNVQGELIIPFIYESATEFDGGYAVVDGKYIINTQGEIVVSMSD